MNFVPRWYQQEAEDKVFDYIENGGRKGLVCLPTGTGKSALPAQFSKRLLKKNPMSKIIMVTHSATLIEQNYKTLKRIYPDALAGIHSAGLKSRDFHDQIIYGGIQSMYKHADRFGKVDLVVTDEAHMMSPNSETMYGKFFDALEQANPKMVSVGLTATPYRLKDGMLIDSDNFDDILLDLTQGDDFIRFIDEGYLCELYPHDPDSHMDLEGVKLTSSGDFNLAALESKNNRTEVTEKIVKHVISNRGERRRGMSFCISIAHAEEMSRMFNEAGIPSAAYHSQLTSEERDRIMKARRNGELEMITNVDTLTTGYDEPEMDHIVGARPTQSVALNIQMLGRGTRPWEGKNGTVVWDFAANILRLGSINNPQLPMKKKVTVGLNNDFLSPEKICPQCKTILHASKTNCICGHEFPRGEEVNMNGEVIPGLLIRRDGLREDRLYEVRKHVAKTGMSMQEKPVLTLRVYFKGISKPLEERLYFTEAAKGYTRSAWSRLMTLEPFPSTGSLIDDMKECARIFESKSFEKAHVWVNHMERGKPSPKMIELL